MHCMFLLFFCFLHNHAVVLENQREEGVVLITRSPFTVMDFHKSVYYYSNGWSKKEVPFEGH